MCIRDSLLSVGIVYSIYEDIAKEQIMELYPTLGRILPGIA